MTFQATVVSEQTRQLVTETLQQASRVAEAGNSSAQEGKEEPQGYTDSSSSSTESSQSSQGKTYCTSDCTNPDNTVPQFPLGTPDQTCMLVGLLI